MSTGRNNRTKVLLIIWGITAIAALVVTMIYFGKIGRLYDDAERKAVKVSEELKKAAEESKDEGISGAAQESGDVKSAGTEEAQNPEADPENELTPAGSQTEAPDGGSEAGPAEQGSEGGTEPTPAEEPNETSEGGAGTEAAEQGSEGEMGTEAAQGPEGETQPAEGHGIDTEGLMLLSTGNYVDPNKPMIAMTFDDGPSLRTLTILDALAKVGGRATFFMVGYQIDYYNQCVTAVYEAGCEIGNHTLDHARLTKISDEEVQRQVYDNEKLLNKYAPVGEVIVRPPYGQVDDRVRSLVDRPMFNWSVDSEDWSTQDRDKIVAQVKKDARDGYLILMHDIYDPTMEAAIELIPWLAERYQLVTVSELFEARQGGAERGQLYRFSDPAPTN